MSVQEHRKKSLKELKEGLNTLLQEQFNLRMQKGSGQPPRPHQFTQVRREIARINTVITEKGRENV